MKPLLIRWCGCFPTPSLQEHWISMIELGFVVYAGTLASDWLMNYFQQHSPVIQELAGRITFAEESGTPDDSTTGGTTGGDSTAGGTAGGDSTADGTTGDDSDSTGQETTPNLCGTNSASSLPASYALLTTFVFLGALLHTPSTCLWDRGVA